MKLPIIFEKGNWFVITGEVPVKPITSVPCEPGATKKAFIEYREAIAALPRLQIVNPEALHFKAFGKSYSKLEIAEIIDGEIYTVEGEYEETCSKSFCDCPITARNCKGIVARITLSNTTEQKKKPIFMTGDWPSGKLFDSNNAHSFTEGSDIIDAIHCDTKVEASVEEKGRLSSLRSLYD